MAGLRTEFDFVLPKGFVDDDGVVHRTGTMRLATARDEIEPLRDRAITDPDDPYLTVLVLARVLVRLGSVASIDTDVVERLFAADLAFLQDLYGIINFGDPADVEALQASVVDADDPVHVEAVADDAPAAVEEMPAADAPAPSGSRSRRGRIEEVPASNGS